MGVEFRIIRKDNKTVFDMGKSYGDTILNFIFSPEELLEYILLYQVQLWDTKSDALCALLIRDRMLDFVEGAYMSVLEVKTDHWWEDDHDDYIFTHDRYLNQETIDEYRKQLQHAVSEDYMNNPLEFFRKSGISKKGSK